MEASMSTVPTNLSSVTPRGIWTKGASFTSVGISPWPSFSLRPSWTPDKNSQHTCNLTSTGRGICESLCCSGVKAVSH